MTKSCTRSGMPYERAPRPTPGIKARQGLCLWMRSLRYEKRVGSPGWLGNGVRGKFPPLCVAVPPVMRPRATGRAAPTKGTRGPRQTAVCAEKVTSRARAGAHVMEWRREQRGRGAGGRRRTRAAAPQTPRCPATAAAQATAHPAHLSALGGHTRQALVVVPASDERGLSGPDFLYLRHKEHRTEDADE